MSKLLKLGILAAGGYAAVKAVESAGSTPARNANTSKPTLDTAAIRKLILEDDILAERIRGPKGSNGADSTVAGPTGAKGNDGSVLTSVFATAIISHTTGSDTVITLNHGFGLSYPEQIIAQVLSSTGVLVTAYKVTSPLANSCVITIFAANATGDYTAKVQAAGIPVVPRPYGNSLLDNGAAERGDVTGWNTSGLTIGASPFNGMPILSLVRNAAYKSTRNNTFFRLRYDRLYMVEGYLCAEENSSAFLINYFDSSKAIINANTSLYGDVLPVQTDASTLTFVSGIFGGVGAGIKNLPPGVVYAKAGFQSTNPGITNTKVFCSRMVVREIPLSEPVPYTYAGLPTGQEVFNPGTGARGRYNGTTVNWYTMVP